MTFLEQYGIYIHLCVALLTSCFLVVGSIIAFKSKRTKTTWCLLSSSIIYAMSQLIGCYLNFEAFGFDNRYDHTDPVSSAHFEKLMTYMNYAFQMSTLSIAVFTFAFAVFCFNIANLHKRNEELEFLTSEMAKRNKDS